jgi:hypothetical protein
MARRGVPQNGKVPTYNPDSGACYRPGPSIPPAEAVKVIDAARTLGISVSEYLVELVRRDDCAWWHQYVADRQGAAADQLDLGLGLSA